MFKAKKSPCAECDRLGENKDSCSLRCGKRLEYALSMRGTEIKIMDTEDNYTVIGASIP